ncbi:MAG TPA: MerR family transcriptional regulator [Actinomycetota bacterium]|nr:MerR family transcriptional regulator [Actinomycetota bacterium]
MLENATDGFLRIGELARRTGVSVELLRAWERRYGVLSPRRSPGGYRLYGPEDERRVRRMQELMAQGLSAAEAARLASSGAAPPAMERAEPPIPDLDRMGASLERALDRFDEREAHRLLDRLLAGFTVETVLRDVVLPYLHRLGDRWHDGSVTVAQEHFASNLIRERLLGLARGWADGQGRLAILACPPGEMHDLALVTFGVVLSRLGWRITYLGPDTPIETLIDAARRLTPALVVLAATLPLTVDRAELRRLAETAPLAVAGPGATDAHADEVHAVRLAGDPVSAAEAVASGTAPPLVASGR